MIKRGTTYSELKHEMHERIAKEIGGCGYSYDSLAYYLGYDSKGAISKLASYYTDTVPDLPRIVKLANLLDVNVEYLLCVTDERKCFYHKEPIDWTVVEDCTSKKRSSKDSYSLFKKMDRKNYLRFHRSRVGYMLYSIGRTMPVSDRIKRAVDGQRINNKSTIQS